MKTIDITGENYFGSWTETNTSCRGIVIRDGRLLLSYETVTGQYMIPGGGLEPGEDERQCCAREIAEETGYLTEPSECLLEIDEFYENAKWVNRYFTCKITGSTEPKLTEREREAGMEPRWVPLAEIVGIFSRHADYDGVDEMRRGMYLREYTALCELTKVK